MFAGKTRELISIMRRYAYANIRGVIIKYVRDTRYGDAQSLMTHAGEVLTADPREDSTSDAKVEASNLPRMVLAGKLSEVVIGAEEMIVGVDEGQFFEDLASACDTWAKAGKYVIVAALDTDKRGRWWPSTRDLLPHAECVTKLRAVCMVCRKYPASFTAAFNSEVSNSGSLTSSSALSSNSQELSPGQQSAQLSPTPAQPVEIGGAEMYRATCRKCWTPPTF